MSFDVRSDNLLKYALISFRGSLSLLRLGQAPSIYHPPSLSPWKISWAGRAPSHLTATRLCNILQQHLNPVPDGRGRTGFARGIGLPCSSFPRSRDRLQLGIRCWARGTGLCGSTEKSPRFAERLVHRSQGSTYSGTEEVFPPARGGETFLDFIFLCSTRVGGNPPGNPLNHPVILPAGSCFMLLSTNIQSNWSLWSWRRILDTRIIVCFTSLY